MERIKRTALGAVVFSLLFSSASIATAQETNRPTIQHRFAEKDDSIYGHFTTMTHVRNDFYDSIGFGLDVGYYPAERFGLEARWSYLFSSLSPAAVDVKQETGLTPDARPQHMLMTLGARWSLGYGKMLVGKNSLVHFDPQIALHGGIALAEKRVLPTSMLSLALLTHFKNGVQAKLDLGFAFQAENRNRGWVPSFGFVPTLGIGWSIGLEELGRMLKTKNKESKDG